MILFWYSAYFFITSKKEIVKWSVLTMIYCLFRSCSNLLLNLFHCINLLLNCWCVAGQPTNIFNSDGVVLLGFDKSQNGFYSLDKSEEHNTSELTYYGQKAYYHTIIESLSFDQIIWNRWTSKFEYSFSIIRPQS